MVARKRVNQVSSILQRELVQAIRRSVADPRLLTLMISEVIVSPDMRHAKVYYTFWDKDVSEKEVTISLKQASPYFRTVLAKNTALRFVPQLHFHYDQSIEHGLYIDRLLSVSPVVDAPQAPCDDSQV